MHHNWILSVAYETWRNYLSYCTVAPFYFSGLGSCKVPPKKKPTQKTCINIIYIRSSNKKNTTKKLATWSFSLKRQEKIWHVMVNSGAARLIHILLIACIFKLNRLCNTCLTDDVVFTKLPCYDKLEGVLQIEWINPRSLASLFTVWIPEQYFSSGKHPLSQHKISLILQRRKA